MLVRAESTRTVATVALRGAQFWIDLMVGGLLTCLPLAAFSLLPRNPEGDLSSVLLGSAVLLGAVLAGVLINCMYWVWWPTRHGGQTWGMALLGLRVRRVDGGQVTWSQMALRWILLLVDAMLFGLVGLAAILATRRGQRFGDVIAETVVLRTR